VKGPKCPLSLGLSGSNQSTLLPTHGRFFLPILHDPHQDPTLTRRSGRPCTAAGAGQAASRLLHVPALADIVPGTTRVPSLGAAGPRLSPAPSELCISLLRLRRSYSSRRRDLSPPFFPKSTSASGSMEVTMAELRELEVGEGWRWSARRGGVGRGGRGGATPGGDPSHARHLPRTPPLFP
jgi:hypothetical protein